MYRRNALPPSSELKNKFDSSLGVCSAFRLLLAGFLIILLFYHEDGSDMFISNLWLYQITRPYDSEYRITHSHCCENLRRTLVSSAMWHRVVWYTVTNVFEETAASVFRGRKVSYFHPADEGRRFFRDVGNDPPDFTALLLIKTVIFTTYEALPALLTYGFTHSRKLLAFTVWS
jgi:hypothetical protein